MTTPDPQFNYTGVRVFNNGANRIASFDQPMFVGNTYVFSFFVKCYGERTIFPRISYNGYDGIGAGEILYTNEDGNWEVASGNVTIGNNYICTDDDRNNIDADNIDDCICGPGNFLQPDGTCENAVGMPEELTGNNWDPQWVRIAVSRTIDSTESLTHLGANRGIFIDDTDIPTTVDLMVWGVQLEMDGSPSKYIPELGGNIKMNYKDEE